MSTQLPNAITPRRALTLLALAPLTLLPLSLAGCHIHAGGHEREVRVIHRERVERDDVHREHRGHDSHRERERDHDMLEEELHALRAAMHGLLELEKQELAEQVEHAIHARELRAEGRRDREAIEIMETSPEPGHLFELVEVAKGFWAEQGQERKVELLEEFQEHLREQWEHREERGAARERHEAAAERHEAAVQRETRNVEHALRRLEEQHEVLRRQLEELREMQAELKERIRERE